MPAFPPKESRRQPSAQLWYKTGMAREFSAGGVVIRNAGGEWQIAIIEPQRETQPGTRAKIIYALPKGLVDPGEKPDQAALREVREETGVEAELVVKLTDIKYFYIRTWGDGERVFKIVSFFLLRYVSGNIGEISDSMKHEVRRAFWLPLQEAARRLTYKGERDAAKLALKYVTEHMKADSKPPR